MHFDYAFQGLCQSWKRKWIKSEPILAGVDLTRKAAQDNIHSIINILRAECYTGLFSLSNQGVKKSQIHETESRSSSITSSAGVKPPPPGNDSWTLQLLEVQILSVLPRFPWNRFTVCIQSVITSLLQTGSSYLPAQLQPKPQRDKFAVSCRTTFMYEQRAVSGTGGDKKLREAGEEALWIMWQGSQVDRRQTYV